MKKKIGVSYTEILFKNYWNWFTHEDLKDEFELVELSFEKNNTPDIYKCDGFVLTGGVDVHPSLYKGADTYNNSPELFHLERDVFESKIYHYAQLNKLPVLGICRGMQLINVLEGGKLIQDLDNGNERHKKEQTDKEHVINVESNSLLNKVAVSDTGHVNSAHHQAIDPSAIGSNLKVNAFENDDEKIIEGLEFTDKTNKGFMLCVQWHPERIREKENNPLSENLKKEFMTAVKDTNNKKLIIANPANDEIIAALNEDSRESLVKKIELLHSSQATWGNESIVYRVEVIKKFSALLEENIEQLASVLSTEVGKPLQQSRNEINGARNRIKWMADNAEKFLSDEVMTITEGLQEKISYEPLGVICNISAWNYPWLVGVNVFVPALLAGNAVMYKPSEYSTLTGLEIERLLKKAGVPENIFHMAIGGKETGEILVQMDFDGYFFTGSFKTGKHIYEAVAHKMVPCQLELGGKDPLYVCDDVKDVHSVAAATADGAFYNNGQSCCAVERIYVHERIYDEYIDAFIKEVRSWRIGLPGEQAVYIGPLTRKVQLDLLEEQVQDAIDKGAKLLTGGKRMNKKGNFFEPTVFTNVTHDMLLMREESFGPIIGVMKVENDAEALKLMQDTEYGLTASVYSDSKQRAEKILNQLNTGTGYWNCCDRVSAAVPWSGRKHSGIGSTLSHQGLRAFTKPKAWHLKIS